MARPWACSRIFWRTSCPSLASGLLLLSSFVRIAPTMWPYYHLNFMMDWRRVLEFFT